MFEDDIGTGGMKSGSCLIAGFHQKSGTHPSYWHPQQTESGATFSIDMVRLKLSFINGKGEWLSAHAQTFDCDSMSAWTSKIRPGGWYELWSFALGDSSVALGIGFMEPSCKVNMNRGFVEFNPNKVAGDKRFWRLLEKLAPCVSHASLKRYDLAYDIERARKDCRLSKDRRMYKAVISNGITEYLGVKNTAGYVKVYDKAAEMNLSGVLTRIELTCDGEWDAAQVVAHWPQVHAWSPDGADDAPQRSQGWLRALGMLLAERAERNEEIETFVSMLDWYQRLSARGFLRPPRRGVPNPEPEPLGEFEGACPLVPAPPRAGQAPYRYSARGFFR